MSGAPPRVFIAHLAGVSVFDPHGDQVGRIRDVVVTLQAANEVPRVLGLVVEVQPRRRIFVPMTRVTAVDSGQVITTGVVNLRRFEQRSTETLVLGEILDRKVMLSAADPPREVTVVDAAMEPGRTRDWTLTKLYVRHGGRSLRRRAETTIVDWDAVEGLTLLEHGQGAASLLATFEQLRPADLATVLHELAPKRRLEVAAALTDEKLADVLEELPEDDQVEILGQLAEDRAADVLEEMSPDDAADLLAELPPAEAARLLDLMRHDEAEDVRRLLSYEERTAGGLMTTVPIILPPDATVAAALAAVRNPDLTPALAAQVFICRPPQETPSGRFLGTAHFQRLLREPPSALVSGVLDTEGEAVGPETPLEQVSRYFASYNLVALPVVGDDGRLLGAVTVDDVIDHMLPADWREGDLSGEGSRHGA